MRLIDAHLHLYPPEVAADPAAWASARGEHHWAKLCTRRRKDGTMVQAFPGVDRLLRAMDEAGVAKAVLLGWYWEWMDTCIEQNKFYAACVRAHPDRLAAFATVHPGGGSTALDEVRRAAGEGLIGLGELSPHSQKFPINDPTWQKILALAGELRLPVNLHVSDPGGSRFPGYVATPLEHFKRLAQEFPQTTFILAHLGGGLIFEEARAKSRRLLANVYYDTAAAPLIYPNTEHWRAMLDMVPAGKILFGTDYPLNLYPGEQTEPGMQKMVQQIAGFALKRDDQAAILGGNAERVLRV